MEVVKNISPLKYKELKDSIAEAFVSNELFREFGNLEERRSDVLSYMSHYVDFVYNAGCLYWNEQRNAYIGLCYSEDKHFLLKLKMLFGILRDVPFPKLKRMLRQIKDNAFPDNPYFKDPYLEVLMVCVAPEVQGQGYSRELICFAQHMAKEKNCPLLIDTDMSQYAAMYQHYGCELYRTATACNGVTRYNIVWKPN